MSTRKKTQPHSFIFVDPETCTGCETCESICSFVHDGEFNPMNSRIFRVRIEPLTNIALSCQKCENPACVRVCPRKALEKDEKTGSIKIDEEKCDGCAFCLRACDFGAITLHLDKKTVVICDLCEDMLPEFIDPEIGEPQPQCVEICPKDSVSLKSVSEIGQESRIDAVKRLLTEESRKNDE